MGRGWSHIHLRTMPQHTVQPKTPTNPHHSQHPTPPSPPKTQDVTLVAGLAANEFAPVVITKPFLLRAPGTTPPGQEPRPGDDKVCICCVNADGLVPSPPPDESGHNHPTHKLKKKNTPTAHRPLGPSAPRHAAAAREDAAAGRGHGDGAVVDGRARPQFCGYPGTYMCVYIYIVVGFGVYWPVSSAKATLSTPANHTHLPNTNQPLNEPNQPPPKQTGGGQGQELGLRRRDRGPAPDDHDAGAQGAAVPEREGCVCVVVCLYLVMCVGMKMSGCSRPTTLNDNDHPPNTYTYQPQPSTTTTTFTRGGVPGGAEGAARGRRRARAHG